ncbi:MULTISPECIES: FCD domain-containing protein [unclassified Halomonas]|uniref:FCD domain-containing protein n=1 Tax=Halomonas sp. H10-59 TaxID=2950874 RepID=A0AAU7KP32_9GAMM|nr:MULTISPECIES: FCD domain-containing protein [unclassified Halomonas]KJZ06487.1 GntR family transcriptional regulator [Halomonas sp. S2151]MCJ8287471.1 FCD domain-containing protein [Halomonas sp.]MCO7217286.1 FCD domain-containing protein [Halomonas sp. OfavH-34-E]
MAVPSRSNSKRPSVADYLAEAIFGGHYRPGDFVPKEVDLAEQFALNRSAVRSDLRQLVDVGIIERISGHGSKVREVEAWNILDPSVTDWMTRYAAPNPEIQREILSFRLDVEPYVAMTAARRATARDLVAIEEAFEGMESAMNAAEGDAKRLHSDHDIAFHVAIFKATRNIVWSQLSHILRPSIYLLIETSNESASDPEDSLERHRELMEAIRTRRPQDAFRAAQAVLAGTADALGIKPGDSVLGSDLELPPTG